MRASAGVILALGLLVASCGRVDETNPNWPEWCLWVLAIGGCL